MASIHPDGPRLAAASPVDFAAADIDQSIPARFELIARVHGERLALADLSGSLSYGELNRSANRLARAILAARGPGQEPVALLAEHGRNVAIGILGILKAGKIVAALHPGNPVSRLRTILSGSEASLVVTDSTHRGHAGASANGLAPLLTIGEQDAGQAEDNPGLQVAPDEPAWIVQTSGSTGEPKGVFQSHRNMLHGLWWCTHTFGITAQDRLSCLLPCSVVGGFREILLPLVNGASLHPRNLKGEGLAGFADWLASEGISVCRFISSVFRSFAGMLDGSEDLSALRVVYVGGESLTTADAALFQQHFPAGCAFINAYGATEIGISHSFVVDHESLLAGNMIPVGNPVDGYKVDLLDEHGQAVADGEAGEIVVTSTHVALGYWNQPELTRRAFLPDPAGGNGRAYRTGDLGRLTPTGCLEFLGRRDSQVSINGYRTELGDIEAALLRLESVADGIVTTREDPAGRLSLIAFVVAADAGSFSADSLRDALRRSLPDHMVPTAFVPLTELPRKPNGKIDRQALPFPEAVPAATNPAAPRNRTERRLQKIWEKCLRTRPVGVEDNFFTLGGDSLNAVQVMAHVAKSFGRDLRPATLYEAPTIRALASRLDEPDTRPEFDSLLPVQVGGSRTPFFWIHGDHSFSILPDFLGPDQPIYGIDHQGQNGTPVHHTRVETVAAYYLSEIRKVRPHGPYLLGGYSFGGISAFEIAHMLRRAGEEVLLLFILDSFCPVGPAPPTQHRPAPPQNPAAPRVHPLRRLVRRARAFSRRHRERFLEELKWHYCRTSLALGRRLPPKLRTFHILRIYDRARDTYRPQTLRGNVVYINCSQRGTVHRDNWRRKVEGRWESHEFPGNHNDMRQEKGVHNWAPVLKRHLDAADPLAAVPQQEPAADSRDEPTARKPALA